MFTDSCNIEQKGHLVIGNPKTRYMFTGIESLTCLQTLPYFVVSRDHNCLVGQLGGMKNLGGKLKLFGLGEVPNTEEACKAKLCEKSYIQHLLLSWSNNENDKVDGDDGMEDRQYNDEDVMEGLKAHPNLKALTIEDFMGTKLAPWITMMTNLVKLSLRDCKRCDRLPALGHLPKLKVLKIKWMGNIKVMGSEICGGVESGVPKTGTEPLYPSLTDLTLWSIPFLEKWEEGGDGQSAFPKLEKLVIEYCPMLRKIPYSCFPSLKNLRIRDLESSMIKETLSRNVGLLTTLELTGSSCSSSDTESVINVLLERNSPSLTKLILFGYKGLEHLTLGVSLEKLGVYDCPHLISINVVEGSAGLKQFSIGGLPFSHLDGLFAQIKSPTLEFVEFLGPFQGELNEFPCPFSSSSGIAFPNLKYLGLYGWEEVKSIAIFEQLQYFSSLTLLIIKDFKGVRALPDSIANLPSLKYLRISDCENLESLPMFKKSHSLQQLEIRGCPILKERYNKGSGPEWFKIQHIPRTLHL